MTAPFRVLVTGSRTWTDVLVVRRAIERVYLSKPRPLVVVHGACPEGADRIADDWVCGGDDTVWVERYPADWKRLRKRAGFERNSRMVAAGADLCLAFAAPCVKPACRIRKPHPSHGTADCADKALAAGIPIDPYGPFAARWAQQTLEAL